MTACFELIESEFLEGPWVFGDRYTVSDMYLFTVAQWLEGDSVDIRNFPKVNAHTQRMLQDPAVTRALAAESAS